MIVASIPKTKTKKQRRRRNRIKKNLKDKKVKYLKEWWTSLCWSNVMLHFAFSVFSLSFRFFFRLFCRFLGAFSKVFFLNFVCFFYKTINLKKCEIRMYFMLAFERMLMCLCISVVVRNKQRFFFGFQLFSHFFLCSLY